VNEASEGFARAIATEGLQGNGPEAGALAGDAPAGDRPSSNGRPQASTGEGASPPTKRHGHGLLMWGAFLAFSPICIGVVVWSALGLNGSYPTVSPPVPRGWQAVPGIYASFSAPRSWSLQQDMSDASDATYYSGTGGSAGESVTQAGTPPARTGPLPAIVATFLGGHATVVSQAPVEVRNAAEAWRYELRLDHGASGLAIQAWVRQTQSDVWLVAVPASPVTARVLSTLTLAAHT